MHVSELMTPSPVLVTGDTTVATCAAHMQHLTVRHLPLVDADGRLAGIVTDAGVNRLGAMFGDVFVAYDSRDEGRTAGEVAVPADVVVDEAADVAVVLRKLAATRQDCVVVVNDRSHPVGILTEHDLLEVGLSVIGAERSISELPPRPLVSLAATSPAAWALDAMTRLAIRHLVVTNADGRLVGVVSHRDLVADDVTRRDVPVSDVVRSLQVVTVAPNTAIVDCARLMLQRRVGSLPVVIGDHAVRIVTRRDVIDAAATALEGEALFGDDA